MELSIESSCQLVTWTVRDFFQLPSKIGYSLDSPEIRFAGDSYCLRLNPNIVRRGWDGTQIKLQLLRLTSTFPERQVSCKIGHRIRNNKGNDIDVYHIPSTSINIPRSFRDNYAPDGTYTALCFMRLKEQSTAGSQQSEEDKTSDTKEEQKGLLGQSVFISSRSWSLKMELSIESPCQNVTWKVPDVFQLLSKTGYSLNSPEFRFAGDTYCLRFYPKGDRNADKADTDLQLVRLTSTYPERIVLYKVGSRQIGNVCFAYTYTGTLIDGFGFCSSLSELERMKEVHFPDGTLIVVCYLRLKEQSSAESPMSAGNSHAEEKLEGLPDMAKLLSDYKQILEKGAESDACLVVSGKEFRAHKNILRARSPVFDAMFDHDTVEKESGRVVIDDLDPESFGDFLEYLYTGRVGTGLSDDNAFGLYAAADKYDVPTFKSKCVAYMCRTLSVDSFCDVISLALRHQEKTLLQKAVQFFRDNMARIIVTVKWQQFVIDNGMAANELLIKAVVQRKQ